MERPHHPACLLQLAEGGGALQPDRGGAGHPGRVGMSKRHFHTRGMLENVSMLPMMVPEIILGMAYLAFFNFLQIPSVC